MKEEKLYRGYKVRLFPTPEQEELMWKHINHGRFVWNYMFALQESRYEKGMKYLNGYEMQKEITLMKKLMEFDWLKEVGKDSLDLVCKDLDRAYCDFFNKSKGKPKWKFKKDTFSFAVRGKRDGAYFINNSRIQIPRIGNVKCVAKYNLELNRNVQILNPRIEYVKASKKWVISFALLRESQAIELANVKMGIDLGVKEQAVAAVGDRKIVFHNINNSKRMRQLEKKRNHVKRAISRKYRTFNGYGTPKNGQVWKKSKSIEKYEQMLREIESKMSNIRHNYIHQITRELVNMLPECVVMEDLNVQGLLKNKHLSKSISEQNFYFFIQIMKYKCEEYSIKFVQADRFYPSSKLCSNCGHKKKDLKLKDRTYICPVCGLEIDRDYNAAINLMNYTENKNTTDRLVTKVERKKMAQKTTIVSVA